MPDRNDTVRGRYRLLIIDRSQAIIPIIYHHEGVELCAARAGNGNGH
jgi:hypothetical protein